MKQSYQKPVLRKSENAVFERVYAGGCTKVSGRAGCYWDVNETPNANGNKPSGNNAHKSLDPSLQPESEIS